MRFAICNELFGDWSWAKSLQMARQCGYTGVEVAPFTLGQSADVISADARKSYAAAVADNGMEVIGLHWLLAKTSGFHLTTSDAAVRKKTGAYFGELIKLCRDLGGNLMVLGSPQQRNFSSDQTHDQAMAHAAEILLSVVPVLIDHEVQIALEPLGPGEGNFLNTASQARTLIEMVDSPQVRLHLDVKAMSSEFEPIDEIIRGNADIMIHFHANDPNLLGPGMGKVNFGPIFQALKDVGYEGWVSVEVFDYAPGIETILQESMRNMVQAIGLTR